MALYTQSYLKTVLKADLIAFVARQPDIVWPRKLGNWHPPNYPTAPQIRKALANPRNGYRRAPLSNHAHQSATPDSDGSVLTPIAMSDDEEMPERQVQGEQTAMALDYPNAASQEISNDVPLDILVAGAGEQIAMALDYPNAASQDSFVDVASDIPVADAGEQTTIMPGYLHAMSQDNVVDESIDQIVSDAIDIALLGEVVDRPSSAPTEPVPNTKSISAGLYDLRGDFTEFLLELDPTHPAPTATMNKIYESISRLWNDDQYRVAIAREDRLKTLFSVEDHLMKGQLVNTISLLGTTTFYILAPQSPKLEVEEQSLTPEVQGPPWLAGGEALLSFDDETDQEVQPHMSGPLYQRDPNDPEDVDFFIALLTAEINAHPVWKAKFRKFTYIKHKKSAPKASRDEAETFAVEFRNVMKDKTDWEGYSGVIPFTLIQKLFNRSSTWFGNAAKRVARAGSA